MTGSCPICLHQEHEGYRCLNMASDNDCSCDRRTEITDMRVEANADYREIFGRDPEVWRHPLGALILTLAGDPEKVDVVRAQHEVKELTRVLNEEARKA